jgi:parallel beta-helix repeat protein
MLRRLLAVTSTMAIVAASLLAAPHPAGAGVPPPQGLCGVTVTADTVLHEDLVDCPDRGILIGADDLILDLNGHRNDGDGSLVRECPDRTTCDVGVDNSAGHEGLRVIGGSITDFGVGVLVVSADRNSLSRLDIRNNFFAGAAFTGSDGARVVDSVIAHNGLTHRDPGLVLLDTSHSVVKRNRLSVNGNSGVLLAGRSEANQVLQNTIVDNVMAGIVIADADKNVVRGNRVRRNGDGIVVSGDANRVSWNSIDEAIGCPGAGCGSGISLQGGAQNVVARNAVRGARTGIRVEGLTASVVSTIVRRNVVEDASLDGIAVNAENAGPVLDTLVARNLARRAGDDGLDVASASTTLTDNVAVRDGDLGIEAVAGVVDGGGNRARRNGNPLQCTAVVCDDARG